MLGLRYKIEIDKKNPDLLIYSCFGNQHLNYRCRKLFFTGENTIPKGITNRKIYPDYNECDASLSYFKTSEKNLYFPLWVIFINWFGQINPVELPSNPTYLIEYEQILNKNRKQLEKAWKDKTRFCAFINNNPIEDRIELFNRLSKYSHIDSYGSLFNNTGGPIRGSEETKLNILNKHLFTISYENSIRIGYNTEKIVHPYSVNCMGIYSGGIDYSIFTGEGIIDSKAYDSLELMCKSIYELAQDKDKWINAMNRPLFKNNKLPEDLLPLRVLDWLTTALDL